MSTEERREVKKKLRREVLARRAALTEPERERGNLLITERILGHQWYPQGRRCGYGGGFYDRYLADREALRLRSIAVGFRCQQVESVPVEETDVKPYQVILV